MRHTITLLLATTVSLAVPADAQRAQQQPSITPQELARVWDAEHVSPPLPPLLNHAEVVKRLDALRADPAFKIEKIGESVEGRSINHVQFGTGQFGVLLWSQMHGDEPTATAALFDVFEYFRKHREEPLVERIYGSLTLHVVPMLNPDGAERFQRRNAQSLDVNRDALRLQTPEGRILKDLRDRVRPRVGFNLHNQSWTTSVGDPPKPASISLLSVAYDKARTENEGRKLTKKLAAVVVESLEPYASGQIGKYDDEFEERAFGDNITLWGTPVLLIETGPWPSVEPDPALVRLNFIAILSALDALATGRVDRADPERYDSLPMNESRTAYVLVTNATVINGAGIPPFMSDISVTANRRVREVEGRREIQMSTNINDMGDLRGVGALRSIDATGMTVVPLTDDTIEPGQVVDLPEWKTKTNVTVAVGQPARFAILKPAPEPGKFVVAVLIR
jgi:hypothetical protein